MNREFLIKPITEIQMDEERKNQGLSELLDPSMGIAPYRYRFVSPLDYDFKGDIFANYHSGLTFT